VGTSKTSQTQIPEASVQAKEFAHSLGGFSSPNPNSVAGGSSQFAVQKAAASPVQFKVDASSSTDVQFHGGGGGGGGDVHSTAKSAFQGGGSSLPHQASIEGSFGADMSSVQAYTGPAASAACDSLGAQAFTMGNKIAFKESSPSVQLAAHEAAHVVQQAQGVSLSGGVGQVGDKYEVAADNAASAVVQNKDASAQLGTAKASSGGDVQKKVDGLQYKEDVQFLGSPLGAGLPEGAEEPAHMNTNTQRKYSVEQYVAMWEKEAGRTMSAGERKTLERGCIGVVALNLSGGGNPPLDNAYDNFEAAHKLVKTWNEFIDSHRGERTEDGQVIGANWRAVLFAKLFWSNQSDSEDDRKTGDKDAFKGDPENDGKVAMDGYLYRSQPGFINFDYGFWDEGSQCFWHANHSMPGMQVYQSTKDKFSAGYKDFDRVIFCAGIATNYNAPKSATAH